MMIYSFIQFNLFFDSQDVNQWKLLIQMSQAQSQKTNLESIKLIQNNNDALDNNSLRTWNQAQTSHRTKVSDYSTSKKKLSEINTGLYQLQHRFSNFQKTLKQFQIQQQLNINNYVSAVNNTNTKHEHNLDSNQKFQQNQFNYNSNNKYYKKQPVNYGSLKKKFRVEKIGKTINNDDKVRINNRVYTCRKFPASYFQNAQALFRNKVYKENMKPKPENHKKIETKCEKQPLKNKIKYENRQVIGFDIQQKKRKKSNLTMSNNLSKMMLKKQKSKIRPITTRNTRHNNMVNLDLNQKNCEIKQAVKVPVNIKGNHDLSADFQSCYDSPQPQFSPQRSHQLKECIRMMKNANRKNLYCRCCSKHRDTEGNEEQHVNKCNNDNRVSFSPRESCLMPNQNNIKKMQNISQMTELTKKLGKQRMQHQIGLKGVSFNKKTPNKSSMKPVQDNSDEDKQNCLLFRLTQRNCLNNSLNQNLFDNTANNQFLKKQQSERFRHLVSNRQNYNQWNNQLSYNANESYQQLREKQFLKLHTLNFQQCNSNEQNYWFTQFYKQRSHRKQLRTERQARGKVNLSPQHNIQQTYDIATAKQYPKLSLSPSKQIHIQSNKIDQVKIQERHILGAEIDKQKSQQKISIDEKQQKFKSLYLYEENNEQITIVSNFNDDQENDIDDAKTVNNVYQQTNIVYDAQTNSFQETQQQIDVRQSPLYTEKNQVRISLDSNLSSNTNQKSSVSQSSNRFDNDLQNPQDLNKNINISSIQSQENLQNQQQTDAFKKKENIMNSELYTSKNYSIHMISSGTARNSEQIEKTKRLEMEHSLASIQTQSRLYQYKYEQVNSYEQINHTKKPSQSIWAVQSSQKYLIDNKDNMKIKEYLEHKVGSNKQKIQISNKNSNQIYEQKNDNIQQITQNKKQNNANIKTIESKPIKNSAQNTLDKQIRFQQDKGIKQNSSNLEYQQEKVENKEDIQNKCRKQSMNLQLSNGQKQSVIISKKGIQIEQSRNDEQQPSKVQIAQKQKLQLQQHLQKIKIQKQQNQRQQPYKQQHQVQKPQQIVQKKQQQEEQNGVQHQQVQIKRLEHNNSLNDFNKILQQATINNEINAQQLQNNMELNDKLANDNLKKQCISQKNENVEELLKQIIIKIMDIHNSQSYFQQNNKEENSIKKNIQDKEITQIIKINLPKNDHQHENTKLQQNYMIENSDSNKMSKLQQGRNMLSEADKSHQVSQQRKRQSNYKQFQCYESGDLQIVSRPIGNITTKAPKSKISELFCSQQSLKDEQIKEQRVEVDPIIDNTQNNVDNKQFQKQTKPIINKNRLSIQSQSHSQQPKNSRGQRISIQNSLQSLESIFHIDVTDLNQEHIVSDKSVKKQICKNNGKKVKIDCRPVINKYQRNESELFIQQTNSEYIFMNRTQHSQSGDSNNKQSTVNADKSSCHILSVDSKFSNGLPPESQINIIMQQQEINSLPCFNNIENVMQKRKQKQKRSIIMEVSNQNSESQAISERKFNLNSEKQANNVTEKSMTEKLITERVAAPPLRTRNSLVINDKIIEDMAVLTQIRKVNDNVQKDIAINSIDKQVMQNRQEKSVVQSQELIRKDNAHVLRQVHEKTDGQILIKKDKKIVEQRKQKIPKRNQKMVELFSNTQSQQMIQSIAEKKSNVLNKRVMDQMTQKSIQCGQILKNIQQDESQIKYIEPSTNVGFTQIQHKQSSILKNKMKNIWFFPAFDFTISGNFTAMQSDRSALIKKKSIQSRNTSQQNNQLYLKSNSQIFKQQKIEMKDQQKIQSIQKKPAQVAQNIQHNSHSIGYAEIEKYLDNDRDSVPLKFSKKISGVNINLPIQQCLEIFQIISHTQNYSLFLSRLMTPQVDQHQSIWLYLNHCFSKFQLPLNINRLKSNYYLQLMKTCVAMMEQKPLVSRILKLFTGCPFLSITAKNIKKLKKLRKHPSIYCYGITSQATSNQLHQILSFNDLNAEKRNNENTISVRVLNHKNKRKSDHEKKTRKEVRQIKVDKLAKEYQEIFIVCINPFYYLRYMQMGKPQVGCQCYVLEVSIGNEKQIFNKIHCVLGIQSGPQLKVYKKTDLTIYYEIEKSKYECIGTGSPDFLSMKLKPGNYFFIFENCSGLISIASAITLDLKKGYWAVNMNEAIRGKQHSLMKYTEKSQIL